MSGDDRPVPGLLDVLPADVEAVLRQYDEIVNIAPEVLEYLLEQAQIRAFQRSAGQLACASIMSPVTATVVPEAPVRTTWAMMQQFELRAIAVVDMHGCLVGIISRADFFAANLVNKRYRVNVWQLGFPRLHAQALMSRNVQSALPETLESMLAHRWLTRIYTRFRSLTPAIGSWGWCRKLTCYLVSSDRALNA